MKNEITSAITNSSGLSTEFQYDIMNRVTNIVYRNAGGSTLANFGYSYNPIGMITQRRRMVGTNADIVQYAYDHFDRFASETVSNATQTVNRSYTYDLAGNRTGSTGILPVTYTLGIGDRLASANSDTFHYDPAGNVTAFTRNGVSYALTWNAQYQLLSVSTNGVLAESYTYDALGRRASTTTYSYGLNIFSPYTTCHIYSGDHCIADTDESGNLLRTYTWGPGIDKMLAITVHSGNTATTYYALTDLQGTIYAFVDETGEIVISYDYDAYGNILSTTNYKPSTINSWNRFLFQGREYSHATGLYNFRARWYDPVTGRWLSKDPIGIAGGLNLYAFCGNDPVNYRDPSGLRSNSNEVDFITREQWGAKLARNSEMIFTNIPHTKIIIHHSGNRTIPQSVQNLHMGKLLGYGWGDVAYNYMIGSGGEVYEGRRNDVVGSHTKHNSGNYGSFGICLLGNFQTGVPTFAQLDAMSNLVSIISSHYNITTIAGHSDYNPDTDCPGQNLYPHIPKLPEPTSADK